MPEKYEKETEKNDNFDQHIVRAIKILGAPATAMAALSDNPAVAPAVATGVKVLEMVSIEIIRGLRPREEARVLTAIDVAKQEIQRRLESGEEPRKDWPVSDTEEVVESVLLKVQREPEEKKVRYIGYLWAGFPFAKISVPMAHQLVKDAEQLTYRQLCILKLCAVKDNYELSDKNYREFELESFSEDLYEVLNECADLHNREYIHSGLDTSTMEMNVLSRLRSIVPSDMAFHRKGDYLYNLMKLSQIPDEDIAPIAGQLR